MLAALILSLACAADSPSAQITIQTPTHVEHGTVLAQCPLTVEANYERLVKLMSKPVEVSEVQPIPGVK